MYSDWPWVEALIIEEWSLQAINDAVRLDMNVEMRSSEKIHNEPIRMRLGK